MVGDLKISIPAPSASSAWPISIETTENTQMQGTTYVQFLEDIEIIPNIPIKKEDGLDTISLGSNMD